MKALIAERKLKPGERRIKELAEALRLQELRGEAFERYLRVLQAIEHQSPWRAKKKMVDHLKRMARSFTLTLGEGDGLGREG